ncbi:MAG: mechanosensitive ion channel family protein, partial [Bdellovibrionales bacterium]|nr:mechanosensitive ion channel family protein [Bdellovibrionales bacterium]
ETIVWIVMYALLEWFRVQLIQAGFSPALAVIFVRTSITFSVLLLALLVRYVFQKFILRGLEIFLEKTSATWDDQLLKNHVLARLVQIAPALVIYGGAELIFAFEPHLLEFTQRLCLSYVVIVAALALDGFLDALVAIYKTHDPAQERPIRAYVQVAKIVMYLVAGIFVVAMLVDRSPLALLSGLGALTAIIMLVFKDSLLGFVASIQLVANEMVRPGDWIEMPKYGADGDVIDVSINTVKVRNWDATISTIPTYALVSDSFKNWRAMSESGARRIKRSLLIDMNSVTFLDEAALARLEKLQLLKPHLERKAEDISAYNRQHNIDTAVLPNGRRLTNLGVFRAYIEAYLKNCTGIHQNRTLLVRHLAPSENGLPIEIYAFANDVRWAAYEHIQVDIFDHLLAAVLYFELRIFQIPSGYDLRQIRLGS